MAIIKFVSPPLLSDGSIDFNHSDLQKSGVYIAGVKILVKDLDCKNESESKEKFCPLIVGESKNLGRRLYGHRDPNSHTQNYGELNSFKEIWDIDKGPISFYKGIEIWNNVWKNSKSTKTDPYRLEKLKTLITRIKNDADNCLLWFPNPLFFDLYFSQSNLGINPVSINWHLNTLQNNNTNYHSLLNADKGVLLSKIQKVKKIIEENFWFTYSHVELSNLKEVENIVNYKLRVDLNIPTYAHSNKPTINHLIDLSAIQNILVNMTGKPFPQKLII